MRRKRAPNPWVRGPVDDEAVLEVAPEPEPTPVAPARLEAINQPGTAGPTDAVATRDVTDVGGIGVWWVGAHGGAGESTLEQLVEGTLAAGRAWPVVGPHSGEPRARAAVVARTTAAGLHAAQQLTRQWATGSLDVELVGLVLIADARGRLPRALRELAALVAGGAPELWELPWVEAWRTEQPSLATAPRAIVNFTADIAARFPAQPATHQPEGMINAHQS